MQLGYWSGHWHGGSISISGSERSEATRMPRTAAIRSSEEVGAWGPGKAVYTGRN